MSASIERIQRFPVTVANPPAGQGFVLTPTGRGTWRVLSIVFDLATSAVAGDRAVSLAVTDGTSTWLRAPATATLAASLTGHFSGFPGMTLTGAAGDHLGLSWPREGVVLPEGVSLVAQVGGMDAADQLSNICAYIEELPSGPLLTVSPVESYMVEGT